MFDETEFLARLEEGPFHVGIIGMGYVGLPLALTFVERTTFALTGFDTDSSRVASLREGRSYFSHIDDLRLRAAVATNRFTACDETAKLAEQDVILIAVPTPLGGADEPDLSCLREATESVAATLRPRQLVIVESTTYPGTTEELVLPILERSGLRCGADFLLAYSPEREDPGNPAFATRNIAKLVGGLDAPSTRLSRSFYAKAIEHVVPVAHARIAEAAKLTENVFRAVNIALVNELKVAYDAMGIDIWDVLDAADTKPFGYLRFNPGPGLGGHCIPIDPVYLSWAAKQRGASTRLVDVATEVNSALPKYVAMKLASALRAGRCGVQGCQILLLGVAYKRDIDDTRESPAYVLVDLLMQEGAQVSYHDPFVPTLSIDRNGAEPLRLSSQSMTAELLAQQDAVVIVTDHSSVDYALVLEHAPLIVDPRGVYRKSYPHVIKA